jgi:hypothetical protein
MRPSGGYASLDRVRSRTRWVKDHGPGADASGMTPGGGAVRRRAIRGVAILLTVATAMGAGAASAGASVAGLGEDGSGPAAPPLRVQRTVSFAASGTKVAGDPIDFSDVGPGEAWAAKAIDQVAAVNAWMRDFRQDDDGTYRFRPNALEPRRYFARAIVKAFAPDQAPDPATRFADLDASSPWLRWAAVAVDNGWMTATPDGRFAPDDPVTMVSVHRALIYALGLRSTAHDLNRIHTTAGQTFKVPANFGSLVLGMRLFFRYNAPSGSESMDVGPGDALTRAQVAYSLARASLTSPYAVDDMREQYDDIALPYLGQQKHRMVQWGIRYAGYPYIWGGEWGFRRPEPSALGGQPRTGFDCSGFSWWVLRANDGGAWDVAPPRPYAGWALPQRTSADMAGSTGHELGYGALEPGDLMFYDGDDDGVVDHVDTYIGNGFALDSSSTPGGVTIMWVGGGWYREHFVHGRRILD